MANCILAYPDVVLANPAFATVAFSGGSWSAALPLSNLGKPEFAYVARSTDTALASTQFYTDLGVVRTVRVVAIPRSNVTRDGLVRVRGCATRDTSNVVADSGWVSLYPAIYPFDTLVWGDPSLYDGRLNPEDAAIVPQPLIITFDTAPLARYWLTEFSDVSNPAGYIEIPRIVIAPGWQPTLNMSYGATIGPEDPSIVQSSVGGAEFFDIRTKRRVARFTITGLPDAEALAQGFDMQMRLGVSGQMMFIFDPADAVNRQRRSFLSRMRALSPLDAAVFGHHNLTFEIVEVVA